jgi:hypothetical protein
MPTDATPEAQARAYVALLDTLFMEMVWQIGLSAGGILALQSARQCGLIMISAVGQKDGG